MRPTPGRAAARGRAASWIATWGFSGSSHLDVGADYRHCWGVLGPCERALHARVPPAGGRHGACVGLVLRVPGDWFEHLVPDVPGGFVGVLAGYHRPPERDRILALRGDRIDADRQHSGVEQGCLDPFVVGRQVLERSAERFERVLAALHVPESVPIGRGSRFARPMFAQAIAARQSEIDRLQAEIMALTDVEQILGASASAARSSSARSRKATAVAESKSEVKPARKRRKMSAAEKKAVSERMTAYGPNGGRRPPGGSRNPRAGCAQSVRPPRNWPRRPSTVCSPPPVIPPTS